jgi:hypothetical protein
MQPHPPHPPGVLVGLPSVRKTNRGAALPGAVALGRLPMLVFFAALFLPLCTANNLMASVDLWPSAKLHVSKPTWWLEASRNHKSFRLNSHNNHRPSPSL